MGREALLVACFLACGMSIHGEPTVPAELVALPDPVLLAQSAGKISVPGLAPRNQFADDVHLVLGVATVVVGGLTGLASPEDAGYTLHHTLGWSTAGLAAATLLTGAWAHSGDVGIAMGLNPSNAHALLGIAGGLMMIAAPLTAPAGRGGEGEGEGGLHAALGAGGELLMVVAIALPIVFRPAPAR
jgi:hypothetical protein